MSEVDLQNLTEEQLTETVAAPEAAPVRDQSVFKATYTATGRRKRSVARVILTPGTGKVTINKRTPDDFFPNDLLRQLMMIPFTITDTENKFDLRVNVHGGGYTGQAGAIRHGVSRALSVLDAHARQELKAAGMLTRDSREKERKKYGQRGARARFQFSKR